MPEALPTADRLFDNQEYTRALAAYEAILESFPAQSEALTGRALCLFYLGHFEQAAPALQELLPLLPESVELRLVLAESLLHAKKRDEAIRCLLELLRSAPDNLDARLRLGRLYLDDGDYQAADRCIAAVLSSRPDHVEALAYMGLMMIRFCQFDEALAVLGHAVALEPQNVLVLNNLGRACKMSGRHAEAFAYYRQALALEPDNTCVISNYLLALNYSEEIDPVFAAEEHFRLAPRLQPADTLPEIPVCRGNRPERLRIGYVSGDLYTHSVTYFLEPVLKHHDRCRFELYCYSLGKTHDTTTERLKGLVENWRDMEAIPPESLARQVLEDQIDIFIDLSGHTGDNRLGAFAMRPAPVQISWIGYPATTGLPQMDYYITDRYCDPPGLTIQLFSEKLLRLPRTFCCYLPPMEFPTVTPSPSLTRGFVTFGSFNNFAKVTPSQIRIWAGILLAVPDSRLYLKSMALGSDSVKQRVKEQFAAAGITSDRLMMRVVTSTPLEHLEEYGTVDIALDTFPYHGTTTTCEALWMGTPVVSMAGVTHASRVGVSLLENAGCPELIAADPDDYHRICVTLATDQSRLQQYRQQLRSRLAWSPLLDAPGVTRELEAAFERVYSEALAAQQAKP